MGKEDYAASSGGALKLKGAKNAGIDKKRKKKSKPKPDDVDGSAVAQTSSKRQAADQGATAKVLAEEDASLVTADEAAAGTGAGKTEAERRHDEMRRRRVSALIKFWETMWGE